MSIIRFGQYRGISPALLLLKDPDYVFWLLRQDNPRGQMGEVQQELRELISQFDEKPIIESCVDCGECASFGSVYRGRVVPRWFCDECDPTESGAARGKLSIVRTYGEAILHVHQFCRGREEDLKRLIRSLAQAKGLPTRVGEQQAVAFFC